MNTMLRVFISGIFGLIIVLTLFLFMLRLLNHDSPSTDPSTTTVELVKYISPSPQKKPLKPIEVQKKQREKPKQLHTPNLELTETGNIESGQGEQYTVNSIGTDFGQVSSNTEGYLDGLGGFNTTYMTKYYEHLVKYPVEAKQAGIIKGSLTTRAVFSKSHEFLRYEITEESHPGYFRDVLYQLKFVRQWGDHLYHPKYNVQKKIPKDADNIHHEIYKFTFDLNSSEPVKMYLINSFSQ